MIDKQKRGMYNKYNYWENVPQAKLLFARF